MSLAHGHHEPSGHEACYRGYRRAGCKVERAWQVHSDLVQCDTFSCTRLSLSPPYLAREVFTHSVLASVSRLALLRSLCRCYQWFRRGKALFTRSPQSIYQEVQIADCRLPSYHVPDVVRLPCFPRTAGCIFVSFSAYENRCQRQQDRKRTGHSRCAAQPALRLRRL